MHTSIRERKGNSERRNSLRKERKKQYALCTCTFYVFLGNIYLHVLHTYMYNIHVHLYNYSENFNLHSSHLNEPQLVLPGSDPQFKWFLVG